MAVYRKILGWEFSRMVTIPKTWIKLNGFKKGDLIRIDVTEKGDLILRSKNNTERMRQEQC